MNLSEGYGKMAPGYGKGYGKEEVTVTHMWARSNGSEVELLTNY